MSVVEAEAIIGDSVDPVDRVNASIPKTAFQAIDAKANVEKLRQLAVTCERFTPRFGIEEAESPECLLLDVTGCLHLFGGHRSLATRVRTDFQKQGFRIHVGIAQTIGAAWAMAHFLATPTSPAVVPSQSHLLDMLPPLPVESLRLAPNLLVTLHELGLYTVGQVRALPRADIPSRFGALLKRLDQAFGDAPEFFVAEKLRERFIVQWEGEFPIKSRESLHVVSRGLLDQLLTQLQQRRQGIRLLRCELRDACRQTREFRVGWISSSVHGRHIFELLCLQWEQADLPEEIEFVQLEAVVTGSLKVLQRDLFGHEPGSVDREVVTLFDRLSKRLGSRSVVRARLLPEAQPELAIARDVWIDRESTTATEELSTEDKFCLRPTYLLTPPEPVNRCITGSDGAPQSFWWKHREYRVLRSWPERIESGWWRQSGACRDYFRVEVQTGHHFWIFQRLGQRDWFIHGLFD